MNVLFKVVLLIVTSLFTISFLAQNIGINTTGIAPNGSAMLDVVSSDKGLLIPRVTLTGTTDATTIANGNVLSLLVFNTATVSDVVPGYYYWGGTSWESLKATPEDHDWYEVGGTSQPDAITDNIFTQGNVGIGTITPSEKLEVQGSVKIVDGTEGLGKVLTSDANGKGAWAQPAGWSASYTATANSSSPSTNAIDEATVDFPTITLPFQGRYLCIYGGNFSLPNSRGTSFNYAYSIRAKLNAVTVYDKIYNTSFPDLATPTMSNDYSFIVNSTSVNEILSIHFQDGSSFPESLDIVIPNRNLLQVIYLGE